MKHMKSIAAGIAAMTTLALNSSVQAGTIIGGSSLLTAGYVTQLESWLGEGPLALTNIFTKDVDGTTSADWHNAVDQRGRTISIFEIVTGLPGTQVIGGYNPQSWDASLGTYRVTTADADRTAFIFNLTTGVMQQQCKSTDAFTCGFDDAKLGNRQTYNHINYGPTFGNGNDLYVNSALSDGYSYNYAYGDSVGALGHGSANGLDSDPSDYRWVSIQALETFIIAADIETSAGPTPLPESGALALFGLGLLGLGLMRRRKAVGTVS